MFNRRSKKSLSAELLIYMNTRKRYEEHAERLAQSTAMFDVSDVVLKAAVDTIDEMIEETKDIYCHRFNRKTLKALIKFYKSEEGRNFLNVSPAVDEDLGALAMKWKTKVLEVANQNILKQKMEKGIDAKSYIPPLGAKWPLR